MLSTLLLKILSTLTAIIALIYLCFYLYKKKTSLSSINHQRITLIEKREIDQRTSISLVRIDDREVIIVAHHHGIAVHGMPENMPQKSFKEIVLSKNAVQ